MSAAVHPLHRFIRPSATSTTTVPPFTATLLKLSSVAQVTTDAGSLDGTTPYLVMERLVGTTFTREDYHRILDDVLGKVLADGGKHLTASERIARSGFWAIYGRE